MTLPFHPRPDDPDADHLNTHLDATRSGTRAPDLASSESTEAATFANAADQFRGLARRADAPAAAYLDRHPLQNRWEDILSTAFPATAEDLVDGEAFAPSPPVSNRTRRAITPQPPNRLNAWLSAAIVAVMLLGTIGGAWWLGPGGNGPSEDSRTRLAAITDDDSTPEAIWPQPLSPETDPWVAAIEPEECDIEPMPYEEYAEAVTTDPGGIPERSYEIVGPADPGDAQAAVDAVRGWMACGDLGYIDRVRAYSTTDFLFFLNFTAVNATYREELDVMRDNVVRQWSLWAQETALYPMAIVDGVEPPEQAVKIWEFSQGLLEGEETYISPTQTPIIYFEPRYDPNEGVMLADGRMMIPATYVYWADDPWVQEYGFSSEPNMSTAAVVLKEVDGEWRIDESAIWICIGECEDVSVGTATPIATPVD